MLTGSSETSAAQTTSTWN